LLPPNNTYTGRSDAPRFFFSGDDMPKFSDVCCSPECTNPQMHRGWCIEHYPRCSEPGCNVFVHSRGMCNRHYLKWYASGNREEERSPIAPKKKFKPTKCRVDGCDDNTLARGLCTKHYRRLLRGALDAREIAE
jgi:hypothetical protein